MAAEIHGEGSYFYPKLEKVFKTLNSTPDIDGLIVVKGKQSEDGSELRQVSQDFMIWLLGVEFTDSVLIFTKNKAIFVVTPKKQRFVNQMTVPSSYKGLPVEFIQKEVKADPKHVSKLVTESLDCKNVSVFQEDQEDGLLTKEILSSIGNKFGDLKDGSKLFDQMQSIKPQEQLQNGVVANDLLEVCFKEIINQVEEILDEDKKVKHSAIQQKIMSMIEKDDPSVNRIIKNHNADASLLEFPIPVVIQSGAKINVHQLGQESTANILQASTIFINTCTKYKDMCVMAARTLLVDAEAPQKQAYVVCFQALEHAVNKIQVGQPISSIFTGVKSFIEDKNASLLTKLHSHVGFGIGFQCREKFLQINSKNNDLIEPGMVFHIKLSMANLSSKEDKSLVALGDTVVVNYDGSVKNITAGIAKKLQDINYTLNEEEEKVPILSKTQSASRPDQKQERETKGADEESSSGSSDNEGLLKGLNTESIINSRLRKKNVQSHADDEQRKREQEDLLNRKMKELKIRYENGEISTVAKKTVMKDMSRIRSYGEPNDLPKIKPGQIYVDKNHYTLLLPIRANIFAPFHISTVKNASKRIDGNTTTLRLNFHVPGGGMTFPDIKEKQNPLFVKELTFKSSDGSNNLEKTFKEIQELIKSNKTRDQEKQIMQETVKQEDLQLIKGKKDILENLVIRPNIIGKKTIGDLEVHLNGVRFFSASKGHKVDILFSNVKNAFFQPCNDDDLIVIIHFSLKQPIMIGNKKVQDLQFYRELGSGADDIDLRGARKKINDMDELEQEERERAHREKTNQRFAYFVKQLEQHSQRFNLEFDIPFEDLAFFGNPHKSQVKVKPTKNCLISVSEYPFFVVETNQIEIVHFERLSFGLKNFDIAFIMKDYVTFKRVCTVPVEYLDQIKSYFSSIGVVYSEGPLALNWNTILEQIRSDFPKFIEEGGWNFLQDDDEDEDGSGSINEDSDFGESGDEEKEQSDSGFSDDDDESFSESSQSSQGSLSESAMDWSDMEKQAEEEDRKQTTVRQAKGVPPPSNDKSMKKRK